MRGTQQPDAQTGVSLPSSTVSSLWLVRHAEVEARYQRVFGGRIDMNLSPRGQAQAARLSDYLKNHSLHAVYTSPMKRVQQTFEPLRQGGAPEPMVMPEFREVDFGDWTGHSWEEVQEKFGVSPYHWLDQLDREGIRNAESAGKLRQRVQPALEHVLRSHPRQQVAIVCHGGVIRMILALLLGLPFKSMSMFEIEYASLTRLGFERGQVQLHLLNFSPWKDLP